jgi:PhnB protein
MAKSKGPIPEGFHTVTPYLVMPGIAGLMEFLKQAFDAQEQERMARPDGSIAHAAIRWSKWVKRPRAARCRRRCICT